MSNKLIFFFISARSRPGNENKKK